MIVREQILAALSAALRGAAGAGKLDDAPAPRIQLQVPPGPGMGDYVTDVAIELARASRRSPAEVAEALASHLEVSPDLVEQVRVTPSGWLNFHLKPGRVHDSLRAALERDEEYGREEDLGAGSAVNLEFVSADPTAPLTVAHGRGAALGDAIARILEWSGFRVTREYYLNDSGSQMERLARSLDARYRQALGRSDAPFPADGFPGEYVVELAERIKERVGEDYLGLPPEQRLEVLGRQGRDAMVAQQRRTLSRFGVRFDEWCSEKDLHESGKLAALVGTLRESGRVYENDGALWLRGTEFGDSQDRPLLRSNGRPTYIAADLAYHLDKFRRGYDRVLDIWGPEHAPYVERTVAGMQALGYPPGSVQILIFQPVQVRIDGMSVDGITSGHALELDEILDRVGRDTARVFYLSRPATSPLEFDLDLAAREDAENPAWRVRSACNLAWTTVDRARSAGLLPGVEVDLTPLDQPAEQALMRKLADFPDEVRAAAREREPHRLLRYLLDTAAAFDTFARSVSLDPETSPALTPPRLDLVHAAAIVLRNASEILGLTVAE